MNAVYKNVCWVAILLVISALAALPAQNLWGPITPPPGQVSSFGISPNGKIFAAGSAVLRSTDNGNSWQGIYSLSAAPSQIAFNAAGQVFIGTQGQGLLRSTDEGNSWAMISSGIPDGEVRDVAFGAGGIIYAGTFTVGMYRSTDNGATWAAINNGLPVMDIASITVTTTGRVLVGVKGSNGVYKSDNNGDSWTLTGMPQTSRVYAMIVKPGYLFTNSQEPDNGIYRSTDNGDTWQQIAFAGHTTGLNPYAIDANGNLYIGVPTAGHLYRSTDNGVTWQEYDSGITGAPLGALISPAGYGYAASNSGFFRTTSLLTALEPLPGNLPAAFELVQNYPNPFNPATNIGFRIAKAGFVSLKVYDVAGREAATLVAENLAAGSYQYTWDAGSFASGVYYYRLSAGPEAQTRKMLLVK